MERIGLIDLSKLKWSGSGRMIAVVVVAVVAVAALTVRLLAFGGSSGDVISATAQRQDFVASVVERGVLKASQTVTYSAPRLRHGGGQQIVEIAPEGTLVKPGDMIVRFDDAALKEAVRQQQNSVDQSRAELRKIMAQQESQMASLQASLELSQHSHEQAKLNLSKLEFASEVQKRQEELSFQKSTLSLQKAEEAIESQKRQNTAGLTRTQVRLQRQENDLKEMQQELTQSAIVAEQPGLVSYEMTYSTSGRTKVKLGDTPYSGQAIISIPDLTTMIVEVEISELDIRRVAKGQRALVRVDAYPDTVYSATVTELSPLARRVGTSQMKVFDCTVKIEGTDFSLRPGMTAQVMIVSRYVPNALVVPLDAVFLKEGKAIVYELDGGIHEIPVEVGENNGNYVVINSGLAEGTRVALRDPYVPLKSLQTAGADALRQQRQASGSSGGGETMFFMPGMMGGGGGGRSGGFSGGGGGGGGGDRGGRGGRGGF